MALSRLAVVVGCAVVGAGALVAAFVVTAWALVLLPFALVIGVAAWRGVGLGKTLQTMADTSDDPGSGPAGMLP